MNLEEKILKKQFKTGVIGLGYVGLPLMHSICKSGFDVLGFDIDVNKIEILNGGKSYLDTVSDSIIEQHRNTKKFEATLDFSKLQDVDVIIICVPTPLNEYREPDLSYVIKTVETIKKYLCPQQLIILESTTYPGTIQDVIRPILDEGKLKSGADFYLAFSPEREDPGNMNFETSTIPKVVGADTETEKNIACNFYSLFLKEVVPVSSCATAEAVKITENIFRAVNIALVNELKIIYSKMGIDVWEVIDAAKTKPFGYMPFYPGPGLGGHCIPIDPFYLTWKAKELKIPTRFIELAGEINTAMPDYIIDQTIKILSKHKEKAVKNSNILILGVAYKKNINDQRESPAFPIMTELKNLGAHINFYDPHISEIGNNRKYSSLSGLKSVKDIKDAIKSSDLILLLTDHDDLPYKEIVENASLIIDTRNAFKTRGFKNNFILKA